MGDGGETVHFDAWFGPRHDSHFAQGRNMQRSPRAQVVHFALTGSIDHSPSSGWPWLETPGRTVPTRRSEPSNRKPRASGREVSADSGVHGQWSRCRSRAWLQGTNTGAKHGALGP